MAEVATNVLHNVGNALNSAIVPAGLIREGLEGLRLSSLKKLSKLLDENAQDLPGFFLEDKRGKKVPEFIRNLERHQREEQEALLDKLKRLQESLTHIKEVIRLQQTYAGGVLLEEEVILSNLLEDALRIEKSAIEDTGIKVIQNYDDDILIHSDRHKLMMILINLLSNARDALLDSNQENKEIKLGAENVGNYILLYVEDNGSGILPENLARIFNHGFSTKTKGHGFGLHSAANAAGELGGFLKVESEGADKGARFILELPL